MRRALLECVLMILSFVLRSGIAYADVSSPPPAEGYPTQVLVTCYAPGVGGTIEGPFATSRPGLDGQAIPRTLDDVRLGKSKYVTLACNPANYKKFYMIGTMQYVSVIDDQKYTLSNLIGYCHDTGGAFTSSGCSRWNTCDSIYKHFDIAYGDFRPYPQKEKLANYGICAKTNQTWKQIGGQVDTFPATGVTNNGPSGYTYPSNYLTQATNGNQNVWQTLGQPLLGNSSQSSASVPSSYSTTPSSGYTSYPTTYTSGYGTTQTTGTSVGTTPVSTSLLGSTGQTSTLSGTNTAQSLMNITNGGSSSNAITNNNTNTNSNDGNPVSNDLLNTSNQLSGGLGTPSTTLGTSVAIGTSRPTTFGDSYGSVDTSNFGSDLSSADQSGQSGDGTDASASSSDSTDQGSIASAASATMTTVRAILARVVAILRDILATLAAKLMGGN